MLAHFYFLKPTGINGGTTRTTRPAGARELYILFGKQPLTTSPTIGGNEGDRRGFISAGLVARRHAMPDGQINVIKLLLEEPIMAALVHSHEDQVKVASGLDVLAAIWLFISAFVVSMSPSLAWSNGIIAVIVCVLAAIRAFGAYSQSWLSWVNAILGLWVLCSPWFMHTYPTHQAMTNNAITGIIVIALAVWSALATNTETFEVGPRT